MNYLKTLIFIPIIFLYGCHPYNDNPICIKDKVQVQIQNKLLDLEVACSMAKIENGLMHRQSIESNSGMIFVFPNTMKLSFWMKNTLIPLDIAYIDKDGVITQIEQMQPHDLTPVNSQYESLYAIEVNQGWFEKNEIQVGQKITFLD